MKAALLLTLTLLTGCQERYRYACQDPENWEMGFCKKPICSSSYTCPEQVTAKEILKPEEEQPR
jgi:hypothetical protein